MNVVCSHGSEILQIFLTLFSPSVWLGNQIMVASHLLDADGIDIVAHNGLEERVLLCKVGVNRETIHVAVHYSKFVVPLEAGIISTVGLNVVVIFIFFGCRVGPIFASWSSGS